jgi:mono/diheme cytochrome c family protein
MKRSSAILSAAFAAGALGLASAPHAAASGAAYYTAAQAASGAKLYADNCGHCHGANLEGMTGPALSGPAMKDSQAIADIYAFVVQQMPAGAPGSLSPPAYAAIMAYLLKKNGHPAGSVALSAARAKKITAKI